MNWEIIGGALIGIPVAVAVSRMVMNWTRYRATGTVPAHEEIISRPLDDLGVRRGLTEFLIKQGVSGDADIRDGKVYPPVDPSRLDPLALLFRNAHSMIVQFPNAINGDLYFAVKNPGEGTGWKYSCAGGVGVSDLGEVASVMERVAADYRKSRALYRGMTEDEVTRLVRAGMSAFFKDDGEWGNSHRAMTGAFDDSREFKIAREALMLAFKVKAADV